MYLAQEFHGYLIVWIITNRQESTRVTILVRNLEYCIVLFHLFLMHVTVFL